MKRYFSAGFFKADLVKGPCLITLSLLSFGSGCSSTVGREEVINREFSAVEAGMAAIRSTSLSQTRQMEDLQISIKKLQGRVEELEERTSKEFGKEVKNLKSALDTLQKRVPPPSVVPEVAFEKSLASAGALPLEIAPDFKAALQFIRAGDFSAATEHLERALLSVSGKSYTPEILFWLGVAYDGQEDDRQALVMYHKIVTEHVKSPLVPAALLRQARVFERMRDAEAERTVLKNLINNYPRSPEAQEARVKIAESGEKSY
jgi:TolA-binding protein